MYIYIFLSLPPCIVCVVSSEATREYCIPWSWSSRECELPDVAALGAEKPMWALCNSAKYSSRLSQLSRPEFRFFSVRSNVFNIFISNTHVLFSSTVKWFSKLKLKSLWAVKVRT